MKIALLLAALALPVHAAESPSLDLIKDIEGVYKNRFQNRIVVPGKPDEKYEAEDVVEVLHHDDSHIYVGGTVTGVDGHRCNIAAIASYENGAFVYHDPNPKLSDKRSCMLTVSVKGDALHLSDRATPTGPSTCSALCGKRGSLGDYAIATGKKAKISYAPKLKSSKEYRKAVKAFEEAQR
jgi:hypothetical protein